MNNRQFEAIIIGGGCFGASVFRSLKKKGVRNILVLEKGKIAGGVSSYSGGMTRVFHQRKRDQTAAKFSQQEFFLLQNEIGLNIKKVGSLSIIPQRIVSQVDRNHFSVLGSRELKEKFKGMNFKENEAGIYEESGASICVKEYIFKIFKHFKNENDKVLENTTVQDIALDASGKYRVYTQGGVFFTAKVFVTTGLGVQDLLPEICIKGIVDSKAITTFKVESQSQFKIPNFFDYNNIFYGTQSFQGIEGLFKVGVKSGSRNPRKNVENYSRSRFSFTHKISEESLPVQDIYLKDNKGFSGEVCGRQDLYVLAGWGGGAFKFSPYLADKLVTEAFMESRKTGEEYAITI